MKSVGGSTEDVARFIRDVYPESRSGSWGGIEIANCLLNELHELENRFAAYLTDALNDNAEYQKKSSALMSALLLDEDPLSETGRLRESVLSFNYTDPAHSVIKGGGEICFVRVHGSIGDEIVFGIDGTNCGADKETMLFTKTYRLMGLDALGLGYLVRLSSDEDGPTQMIKFYGHSLGKADYSYFQSIFDAVNLYAGPTRLVFYYRPHDDGDNAESEAREETMQAVTRLLVTYGATLDNVDHGKNLIHKLLLEGRLSVKLLEY